MMSDILEFIVAITLKKSKVMLNILAITIMYTYLHEIQPQNLGYLDWSCPPYKGALF